VEMGVAVRMAVLELLALNPEYEGKG
jgi:aspartate carbamoyltransferase catalytic subunit